MNPKKPCKYDAEQISDFFQHLMWEMRTMHFEHQPNAKTFTHEELENADPNKPPPGIHPELMEHLVKYGTKYNCAGLLMADYMKVADDDTKEDVDAATLKHRDKRREACEKFIEALELISPLLEEAMFCIDQQRDGPILLAKQLSVKDILEERFKEAKIMKIRLDKNRLIPETEPDLTKPD